MVCAVIKHKTYLKKDRWNMIRNQGLHKLQALVLKTDPAKVRPEGANQTLTSQAIHHDSKLDRYFMVRTR
jgi:hypothetical protein